MSSLLPRPQLGFAKARHASFASALPFGLLALATFATLSACSGSNGTTPAIDVDASLDSGSLAHDSATDGADTAVSPADSGVSPIFDSSDDAGTDATPNETGASDSATSGDTATGTDSATTDTGDATTSASHVQTVFLILLENHSWASIKGSSSAPYLNSLLSTAAHAENYKTPPGNHPSEPNYIWLESGSNLGITTDDDPSKNHQSTKDHLVSQLETAGISWKAYVESVDGTACPLTSTGLFAAKHTPQLFFDDVTGNSSTSAHCIAHVRPYTELMTDLSAGTVSHFNFITPNLCDDMHGESFGLTCEVGITDLVKAGDTWLSKAVPAITASAAYKSGGAIFIVWDEGDEPLIGNASDGPIGMVVLSPFAKAGYSNMIAYTHSSTLRTMETIFGVPYLRGAATATDLGDLFTAYP